MLLLVLILVLIAFGLLVVALLSGSVLWAWVSVGVSVAAAAVLLVDWLQRRSAVRAGAEAGEAVPTPAAAPVPPPHMPEQGSAVEPATEVIPAVGAGGPHDDAPPQGADRAADRRHDERPDTRETVVMRAFAPSGSTEGPSGADGGIAPSGPISSQSVTNAGADAGGSPMWPAAGSPHEGDAGSPDSDSDADSDSETVKVAGAPARARRAGRGRAPARRRPAQRPGPRRRTAGRGDAPGPGPARPGRRPTRGAARHRRGRPGRRPRRRGPRGRRAAALPPGRVPLARREPADPVARPRGRRAGVHPVRTGASRTGRSRRGTAPPSAEALPPGPAENPVARRRYPDAYRHRSGHHRGASGRNPVAAQKRWAGE